MGKLSKCEQRVREEILKKQNLLKALTFDRETLLERINATKDELKTLEGLLTDEDDKPNVKESLESRLESGAKQLLTYKEPEHPNLKESLDEYFDKSAEKIVNKGVGKSE